MEERCEINFKDGYVKEVTASGDRTTNVGRNSERPSIHLFLLIILGLQSGGKFWNDFIYVSTS
jgi:hypothetical protein